MNELKIFKNEEFGNVRAIEQDGELWFVGVDVAKCLGYSNPRKAVMDHVDDEDKRKSKLDTTGGKQNLNIINKLGLYSLILSSKLPTRKGVKRWLLPEASMPYEKNRTCVAPDTLDRMISSPEFGIKILTALKEEQEARKALEERVKKEKIKVIFADAVAESKASILLGDLSELLKKIDIDIERDGLFEWMRVNGYLIKQKGSNYNMPTQKSIEMELFEIEEITTEHFDGHITVDKTTKVTGKGQMFFINEFLDRKGNNE